MQPPTSQALAVVAESGITSPSDPRYLERVYAGVLGKLIGVYLGRPVENWSYERIMSEIGEIREYIHERRGRLLVVTDDDISGVFTFLRALEDYGFSSEIGSRQIGQTWLNYLIERTTILWWGGMGNSTEHTAYLRLKHGIDAPGSGSMTVNGPVVAEQIGAQIFIDGWGLVSPGDPVRAASLAARAARVSHDGEAVYGAQMVAAMVAEAFVQPDVGSLIESGLRLIPMNCRLAAMIADLQDWHARESDWRENRARLEANYGYDKFLGQCPLIPNHGLIILSLLHGDGDFDMSMTIVNTSGWDTDCNSGNVGTILGVRGGLSCFDAGGWRWPVADRLYLPSADGGRAITDAAREAIWVANIARRMAGVEELRPKEGARYHFTLPGSVQGWRSTTPDAMLVEQDPGVLALRIEPLSDGAEAAVDTFTPPEIKDLKTGYVLVANPTLYPSQTVSVSLSCRDQAVRGELFLRHYNAEDLSDRVAGPSFDLQPGESKVVAWTVPEVGGFPIHQLGVAVAGGPLWVERVHWEGVPDTEFPVVEGSMGARSWAKSLDRFEHVRDRYDYLTHNEGVGMLTQGHREWQDYRVSCRITPRMGVSAGIAVRVQGLRRYYAFVFAGPNEVRIDKCLETRSALARTSFPWKPFESVDVEVVVKGSEIRAMVDEKVVLTAVDDDRPLTGGAFGFLVEAGCMGAGTPRIRPE